MSVVEGLAFPEDKKKYILEKLDPFLTEVVTDMLCETPSDPIDHMINWITEKRGSPHQNNYRKGLAREIEYLTKELKMVSVSTSDVAASSGSKASKKVLIVSTSAAKMGDHDTGAWSEEVCGPYYVFKDAGCEVVVCSIAGGDIPIDAGSLGEQFKTENDKRMEGEGSEPLKGTAKLAEQDVKDFDVLFFSGGHGTCVDFPTDEVGAIISKAAELGKVVGAVCHGPMSLVKAMVSGEPLVKGKKIACFSDREEEMVGLTEKVPFLLEQKMKELGANVELGDPWSDRAVRDGNLVTGQNPQSSVSCAKLCL